MKTLEQVLAEDAEIAKLDVCCRKCKFYGRAGYSNREPDGQCQRHAPAKYSVTLVTELFLGKSLMSRKAEPIESPFPGVWAWDKCGEFERAEPTPPLTDSPEHEVQGTPREG